VGAAAGEPGVGRGGAGSEEALLDLVQEGADTASGWAEALEHFEIDEGDCATAVP
jgi:hypothetical protein